MKFKPFQEIDEHDVISIFALEEQTGSKGSVVGLKHGWKSDDLQSVESHNSTAINKFSYMPRFSVKARVTQVVTGNVATYRPFGILLQDVRENADDPNSSKLVFDPTRKAELDAVVSGEAVRVAREGMFLVRLGSTGTTDYNPGIGSGVSVPTTANGDWQVVNNVTGQNVFGEFLGSKDDDGYALVNVNFKKLRGWPSW